MNARMITSVSPPLPQARSWFSWKIVAGALALAVLLVFAEFRWLRERQQAWSIAWANEQVDSKIGAARLSLGQHHWDQAIRHLDDALDVEGATNRDAVHPLLVEAQRGQAEALFDAAGVALAHRRTEDALRLLRAYLAHPQAGHLDHAGSLRDELERAASDDEAVRLLAELPDEALAVFAEKGVLTVDDRMHTAATRAQFYSILRRNLPAEQRKREATREVARLTAERRAAERSRRIARLRDIPVFHSLSSYLVQAQKRFRDQQERAAQLDVELRRLFQALGVSDAAEQQQIRNELLNQQNPSSLREEIERKRIEIKQVFRKQSGFNQGDAELFDQLVDQEVDKVLKMICSFDQIGR